MLLGLQVLSVFLVSVAMALGLKAMAVYGDYVFAANLSTTAQLQVIDISDLSHPKIINSASRKVPNAGGVGNSIFYYNKRIYLGLTKNGAGPQFMIYDVSDPINPTALGSGYNIDHDVNSILVSGDFAYVAHPEAATDPVREQITVLDISHPTSSITRVGGFYSDGGSGGNGKTLYLANDKLYLGRTATKINGTNDLNPEFFVMDNSNPPAIGATLGQKYLTTTGDSIDGIAVRNSLTFVLTNTRFDIWNTQNLSVNSTIPFDDFFDSGNPSNARGTFLNCSGEYIYLALTSPQGNNKDIVVIITPNE